MSELKSNIAIPRSSDKGFGIVFAAVFLLLGLYPLSKGNDPRIWAICCSALFLLSALFFPKALSVPNRLWGRLGELLGAVVAPVMMALIFFVVMTPIGLFIRLTGKDLLKSKLDKGAKTYWNERDTKVGSMKDQF